MCEERCRDNGADRVASKIFRARCAASVSVEASHRVGSTGFEGFAHYVQIAHLLSMVHPGRQPQGDPLGTRCRVDIEDRRTESFQRLGRRLQWATIAWNSVEVFVTVGLGLAARSLALVAFGLDSLVEVFASVVVIWHMTPGERGHHVQRDRRAMRLVGIAFGVLALYLLVTGTRSLIVRSDPASSPLGIAYLVVTALVMFSLSAWKRRVGDALESEPFRAEAAMTLLDGFLALSILTALAVNWRFEWWWADPVAAMIVGFVAAREGVESWREASEIE